MHYSNSGRDASPYTLLMSEDVASLHQKIDTAPTVPLAVCSDSNFLSKNVSYSDIRTFISIRTGFTLIVVGENS